METKENNIMVSESIRVCMIQEIKNLTDSTFLIRFDRDNMEFSPGQYITLGLPGDDQIREYTIYSPDNVDYLEVLVKVIDGGLVSEKLQKLQKGDLLKVDGPFGFFTINKKRLFTHKYLFIATGTGIAPFHSYVTSFPALNYQILHGIRYGYESYGAADYSEGCYISCTSDDKEGYFNGRVTDYLLTHFPDSNTLVYLCGNYEMIQSVYNLLTNKGFSPDNIRTEVYF